MREGVFYEESVFPYFANCIVNGIYVRIRLHIARHCNE